MNPVSQANQAAIIANQGRAFHVKGQKFDAYLNDWIGINYPFAHETDAHTCAANLKGRSDHRNITIA